jgi:hypothetical protein
LEGSYILQERLGSEGKRAFKKEKFKTFYQSSYFYARGELLPICQWA